MARYGIVLNTETGIERMTPLENGLDAVQGFARFLAAVSEELTALEKAVVSRKTAIETKTGKFKSSELVTSGT
jgi:hypothetical protein